MRRTYLRDNVAAVKVQLNATELDELKRRDPPLQTGE